MGHCRSPLSEAMRGVRERTIKDVPSKKAIRAHQDAEPHRMEEPDDLERLKGSAPWGKDVKEY